MLLLARTAAFLCRTHERSRTASDWADRRLADKAGPCPGRRSPSAPALKPQPRFSATHLHGAGQPAATASNHEHMYSPWNRAVLACQPGPLLRRRSGPKITQSLRLAERRTRVFLVLCKTAAAFSSFISWPTIQRRAREDMIVQAGLKNKLNKLRITIKLT
jgi:hypothetical protein